MGIFRASFWGEQPCSKVTSFPQLASLPVFETSKQRRVQKSNLGFQSLGSIGFKLNRPKPDFGIPGKFEVYFIRLPMLIAQLSGQGWPCTGDRFTHSPGTGQTCRFNTTFVWTFTGVKMFFCPFPGMYFCGSC